MSASTSFPTTTTDSDSSTEDRVYDYFPHLGESETESNRLDSFHRALWRYFDGPLPQPLGEFSPRRILDLGCGSGAWATDMALLYPQAQVLAVDLFSPPDQTYPSNVEFQQTDLTKEWPFEDGSFDIVHSRLVLIHLPGAPDIAQRAARLVKRGGYILLEDFDSTSCIRTGGPALKELFVHLTEFVAVRGADIQIGAKLQDILSRTELFSTLSSHKFSIPISSQGNDQPEALRELGKITRNFALSPVRTMLSALPSKDSKITVDLLETAEKELQVGGGQWKAELDMYFCRGQVM
ncbi:S-adenosyl-L-methionine-dependent methyltransferase [Mycena amicta]|nr:S-adenosyl-L-methionine-dependent methyltransferase [Mycena amicta]